MNEKEFKKTHFGGNLNNFFFCYSTTPCIHTGIDITFGPLVNICKTTIEGKII